MVKKLATVVTAVMMIGLGAQPASAGSDWTFSITEIGLQNYLTSDMARGNSVTNMVDGHCLALGVGDCDIATMQALNSNVGLHVNLPHCESATQEYCIESLQVYAEGATPQDATFDFQTFPDQPQIQTDLAHGIPQVGNPLIFKSAGETAIQGSDEFMVQAALDLTLRSPDFIAEINDFKMSVLPVTVGAGPDRQSAGYFAPQDFKPETRAGVKVRIPRLVGGWFKGRLSDPQVDIQNFDETNYVLSVDAKAVKVPLAQMTVSAADCEAFQNSLWGQNIFGSCFGGNGIEGDGMFNVLEAMRPYNNDTAAEIKTAWDVSSFNGSLRTDCLSTGFGLAALVTTNATVFTGAAPEQDDAGLHYKVSGFHLMPDGNTVTQGDYDLLLREDVARCIYNLPADGNLYATVSVADGANANPATVSFGVQNGFAHFRATGFHFSQPIITTKLINVKAPTVKNFGAFKAAITGKLALGKTLKATLVGLPGATRTTLQWYASGKKISGAVSSSLKVTRSLLGKKISAVITIAKAGFVTKKVTVRLS